MTFDAADIQAIALVISMLFAIGGLFVVYKVMTQRQVGFGPMSARSFAVALFVPSVIVVSVTTTLSAEAVAALLGTLAGYIFSSVDEKK